MKVSIFIDGNNFYFSLRRIFGNMSLLKFDFESFCNFLVGDDELVDVYYYNAGLDKDRNYSKYKSQEIFFDKIRKVPKLNLVLCNLVRRVVGNKCYYILKEDDIHLAVDMVMGACNDNYDKAVLVTGDGDFVPAVLAVKSKNKIVFNGCFKRGSSIKLQKSCNGLVKLNKGILDKFIG